MAKYTITLETTETRVIEVDLKDSGDDCDNHITALDYIKDDYDWDLIDIVDDCSSIVNLEIEE